MQTASHKTTEHEGYRQLRMPAKGLWLQALGLTDAELQSADLTALRLQEPHDTYYTTTVHKMLHLISAHEHGTVDFHSAMEMLNHDAMLGLDEIDRRALSYMLTALSRTKRFGSEPHLESELGENSAVHQVHCAILNTELFRRSGLLKDQRQDNQVIVMRLRTTLGNLIHDMGEMLNELSSLSQRTLNPQLNELPDLERSIFRTALHLAYYAAQESEPQMFYKAIADLKQRAGIGDQEAEKIDIKQLLDDFGRDTLSRCYLEKNNAERVAALLKIFDMVELHKGAHLSGHEIFCGYLVKVVEHTQGTRHIRRFATKCPDEDLPLHYFATPTAPSTNDAKLRKLFRSAIRRSIPISLTPSFRYKKTLSYNNDGMAEMFETAGTPAEQTLARTVRNANYETIIEWLNAANFVVKRSASRLPYCFVRAVRELSDPGLGAEQVAHKLARIEKRLRWVRRAMIERHRTLRRGSSKEEAATTLYDVETKGRLMSLIARAIQNDYIPRRGEPHIAFLDRIPPEIGRIRPKQWHLRRGSPFQVRR